ncbi:MAG TPA: PQQ-binding-like beta-propeller repeat protein [Vicinamibacterales bacterium]|nr:PQQ-binding-like beta-propeller repeat protein [Vicinamibacterales bacterium]
MKRKVARAVAFTIPVVLLIAWTTMTARGQSGAPGGEWRTYGGDLGNTRYAPLDQINAGNFNTLEVAWRFKTDNLGPRPEFNLQSTPLMVRGVLYTTAGTRRAVVALNAETGEMKWMYSLDEGKRGEAAPRRLSGRGLSYWTDGKEERILFVTPGYQLIALDAATGRPVSSFGRAGIVDLKDDNDQVMDPITGEIGLHAAPLVVRDVVVVGAAHLPGGAPKSRRNEKGFVRGFDVRSGKRLWIFHTIPQPGEFGNETWLRDSWAYTGNTGNWGQMSADEELGHVYLATEMPTGDYYGGHRPGDNVFADSIVALDARTGKRIWHFQTIHHDIWDWDLPCAPIIANITVNGRQIRALAQPSKQGFLYVFDRTNGQPVWPIEERPVAKGAVPGEWYSPTQPFPTKPPAFERQGVSVDDLIDFTPALRAEAVNIAASWVMGPLFTPIVTSRWPGPLGTLMSPPATGGANWQGGSFDPETGMFYIFTNSGFSALGLVNDPARSDMDFISGRAPDPNAPPPAAGAGGGGGGGEGGGGGPTVQGLPLLKPPYGRITAINLNTGERAWQIAHGETPDNVRNHPALKGLNIPRTGRQGRIGTLVTKTLLIAGEGGFFTTPTGQRGAMLRAYDKATGKDAGEILMPAPQTGSPMTYSLNGRQYIVVPVSGGAYSGEFIAYRLPAKTP